MLERTIRTALGGASAAIQDHPLAAIVLLFLLAVMPVLPSVQTYHGDEHFYTDSAIQMVRSGDYLTPVYPDGTPRFNKPILTYWVMTACYSIMGISLFSSRVGSLVAGCLVIVLTFKMARTLFGRRTVAVVAALIVFSNIQVFNASMRSTPDMYQCLFLSLSLYGFINIIFGGRKTATNYVWAYVGAGLAFEAKGLTGLFPIVLAFAFCALHRGGRIRPRELVHVPAMLIGLVIAAVWFVLVYVRHGDLAVRGFFDDQVGANVSGFQEHIIPNVIAYTVGLFRLFFPWSLLSVLFLPWSFRVVKEEVVQHKAEFAFGLAWYLVLFLIFVAANITRPRYFMPAYPMFSAMLALLLVRQMEETRPSGVLAALLRVLGMAAGACGALLAAAGVCTSWRILASGLVLVIAGGAMVAVAGRRDCLPRFAVLAAVIVLGVSADFLLVRPIVDTTPAPALAKRILDRGKPPDQVLTLGLAKDQAAQLLVLLKGRVLVRPAGAGDFPLDPEKAPVVIVGPDELDRIDSSRYEIEEIAYIYAAVGPHDVRRLLSSRDRPSLLSELRRRCYLATAKRIGPQTR